SMMLPKTFLGSTSMVVNYKGVDSVTGLPLPAQMMPGYIATQIDIIKSKSVALRVVDDLKLAASPAVQEQFQAATGGEGTVRDWLADLLLLKVDVVPARESSVLSITFKGSDPQFVAAIANGFANAYLQLSVQLKTEPAQLASGFITTQIKLLREQYELAQSRLSKYQKENNIYSADNRVDVETGRLNDLSSQLVQVQGLAMEATSRQRQAQSNPDASPDVQNNGLIQGLKSSLALAEGKLADMSTRLAPNHPQYISAKSEVDKLRASLSEQVSLATNGVASNARVFQQREADLHAALAAQKAKVQALNGARDEFSVLTNEMENARKAYETAAQRFNQTSLEGQSKQADIAILAAATAPLHPSGPRLMLNVALAVVVGMMLGMGAALVLELLDPRVRSAAQLSEAFGLPVLGVIEKSKLASRKSVRALPRPGNGAVRAA
ncbi:MAG TPA: chain length determinant protein EpsF, partial [Janthinobacterium sp.]|nr:chain length determinant protein EpsF [Janthinobacterium sp.]